MGFTPALKVIQGIIPAPFKHRADERYGQWTDSIQRQMYFDRMRAHGGVSLWRVRKIVAKSNCAR
jgi:hypothetical protein